MTVFKRFTFSTLLYLISMAIAYIGLFFCQFGAPVSAEYWVREVAIVKEELANRSTNPKVLIVSGSSSLYSIDTALLKKQTGMEIVNFGLHAGLPLDQLSQIALHNAKPGDLVVMPLEYEYYFSDFETPSRWVIEQTVAWNPTYFYELSLKRKWKFFVATTPMQVLKNSFAKMTGFYVRYKNPKRVLRERESILKAFESSARMSTFAYDLLNMNKDGDMMNTCLKPGMSPQKQFDHDIASLEQAQKPLALLLGLSKDLSQKGAKLVLSFPPTEVDPKDARLLNQLEALSQKIKESSLRTLDEPKDNFYSRDLFLDIPYHLNCKGREQRTLDLAKHLKELS